MTDYPTRRNMARIWLAIAVDALSRTAVDTAAMRAELMAVLDKHAPKTEPTSEGE